VLLDASKTRATGVRYVDALGNEVLQPAKLVIVTAFAFHNVRLLLLSGIGKPYDPSTGKGVVGRNYAYQTIGGATAFFDESVNINPFMSPGASLSAVSDYVSDTYDHGPLGFVGGSLIASGISHWRPIDYHPTPPGTARWGQKWKDAAIAHYNHTLNFSVSGSSMPSRYNFLDLDPTYKDAWGMPLLRMTFDFPANDLRMSAFCTEKARRLAEHVGARQVSAAPRTGPYDVTIYQSTHNVGSSCGGYA
jgi:gluconate 2-dehydrogenase alpha chain